jgi:osmotically-inducible protein OsmY
LVLAGAGGAALAYLFDPSMGKTRRTQVRQRTAGIARSTGRWVARASRGAGARAQGLTRRLAHRAHELKDWDDITLAHKVESEVLGGPAIPKEKISVDAHDGIIVLRGEIDDDDLIRLIEQEVRSTPGVRDVENLMHTTGTMPPNRADALRAGRTSR